MGCIVGIVMIFYLFFVAFLFKISSVLGWIGLISAPVILIIWLMKEKNKEYEISQDAYTKFNEVLVKTNDFKVTVKHLGTDLKSGIAIDELNKKICLVYGFGSLKITQSNLLNRKICTYREILKVEVIEDGNTVISTSRTSQIAGAAIGGLLAGGVGAIIGAGGASQSVSQEIKKIELKLLINDTNNPVYYISFLDSVLGENKQTETYKKAKKLADKWHGLISVLIRRADDEEKSNNHETVVAAIENVSETVKETASSNVVSNTNSNVSVADEIGKLAELLREGLITQEEFDSQKKRLLKS